MLTAGPRGQFSRWRRSRKRISVCSVFRCPDLWVQCSVSSVQHGLEKTHHACCVFSKPRTALHAALQSQIWTPQNGAHRNPFPAATPSWKLAPRPRSKHEKWNAGSAWETWTVTAADGVRCARVRWEINFLLTFETAPFFYVYPVYNVAGELNSSVHRLAVLILRLMTTVATENPLK